MGFGYEVIPLEQKNLIDLNRLRYLVGNAGFDREKWCIDRERNAAFLRVPRVGNYEEPLPDRFPLVLSGAIIGVELFMIGYEKIPRKMITWALEGLGVPAEVKASRDEVLALTREAAGAWTPHACKLPWLAHEDMDVVCQF